MLLNLDLKHFVLVEHTHLEFSAGLSTLTGETGAGKSILLDALGFLLGGKADVSWVRHGQTKAEIAASFTTHSTTQAWLLLHEFIEPVDVHQDVQLRRTLDNTGRSRCTINGSVATATQLRELGETLIDIHGQGDHQSLLKPNSQRILLDDYAGNQSQCKAVRQAWDALQTASKALTTAQTQHAQRDVQREQLAWVFDELSSIQPVAGEWEQLETEHKRLSHSATLLSTLQSVLNLLDEAEDSLLERTRSVHHTILSLSKLDEAAGKLAEPLDMAYIHLQEASHSITNYLHKTDLDPEQLAALESRITLIHSVARKLRLNPADLPARFESVQAEWGEMNASQDFAALELAVKTAQKTYDASANALSKIRQVAAKNLSKAVSELMQSLALSGGQFLVSCSPCTPSSHGIDSIEFQVSANVGQPLRALAKVASGGELARMSLALCVITSSQTAVPTLIFDEVDSGIGGATADIVGQQLRQLGHDVQVLAVTHLPQVAANAHQQLKVSKTLHNGETISNVEPLDDAARQQEIARMLGGEHITTTTLQHAQELLHAASLRVKA
jgi:DNA repair protein RecN (Recombination protein N)